VARDAGKHTIQVDHLDPTGSGKLQVALTPDLLDGAWVRWSEIPPEA
jgi:hypothetical protein